MSKILFKSIAGRWVLNIPVGYVDNQKRVFVVSRGRMLKSGKFNNWLPCGYFLTLKNPKYNHTPNKNKNNKKQTNRRGIR